MTQQIIPVEMLDTADRCVDMFLTAGRFLKERNDPMTTQQMAVELADRTLAAKNDIDGDEHIAFLALIAANAMQRLVHHEH